MEHVLVRAEQWRAYPSREYADWFSRLEGMRSPVAVGTTSASGIANLAVFNSMTHIGARPPLLGLIFRPLTVDRHTYDNIKASRVYTINHLSEQYVDALHQTSAKYDAASSEFTAVGLTVVASATGAPYVAEALVSMQLRFVEEHHIAANDCVLVVGSVEELRIGREHGFGSTTDWGTSGGVVVSGLYNYYKVSHLVEKVYAKAS